MVERSFQSGKNNDYYVKQNEELNKEISVGKNNIDSVLEQYKLVADNLKNKNNILLVFLGAKSLI